MLRGLSGRVIEIGAGTGLSFQHYPATVTEVMAVEPEPYLRRIAETAALGAPVPTTVVAARAELLPYGEASFDAGVTALVLCSIADPAKALLELQRVIRPGGQLRFYEHIRSSDTGLARLQSAFDLIWPRVAGGCHASRRTDRAIADSGFELSDWRCFTFRRCLMAAPVSPHMIGTAVRPLAN